MATASIILAIAVALISTASCSPIEIPGLEFLGSTSEGFGPNSEGSTYFISTEQKPWQEASDYCQANTKGKLIAIETSEEDRLIHTLVVARSLTQKNIWTSGAYDTLINNWIWLTADYAEAVYTNWDANEPKSTAHDHYITFRSIDAVRNYKWRAEPSPGNTFHFICEIQNRNDTPVPCHKENDLVIVLDGSGSISNSSFEIAKDFVAKLAGAFQHPSRVSLVVFSSSSNVIFNLKHGMTADEIQAKIMGITQPQGGTETGAGIRDADAQLIQNPNGIPRKMVVLTDGQSNNPTDTAAAAALAASNNIFAYSVGIGNFESFRPELVTIANGNENHVFTVDQFDNLIQLIRPLTLRVCDPVNNN